MFLGDSYSCSHNENKDAFSLFPQKTTFLNFQFSTLLQSSGLVEVF